LNVPERHVLNRDERRETNGELGRVGGNIERAANFLESRLLYGFKVTIVV
jgi:hypothetical protein